MNPTVYGVFILDSDGMVYYLSGEVYMMSTDNSRPFVGAGQIYRLVDPTL